MKRSPLRQVSRKRRARQVKYRQVWRAVMERAGWKCECVDLDTEERCPNWQVQAHHILPRSRGGKDTVENLLVVCARHHLWIHAHPRLASERGWLALREVA